MLIWLCRDEVRKAKVQLELNLARQTKNKKGFTGVSARKKKVKERVPVLINKTDKLVKMDEKAEVLNNFFASVLNGNLPSHNSQVDGQ